MKIYSWNVNGIRAVERKGVWSAFISEHQPDVICIQETKASPDQIGDFMSKKFPEYKQYWSAAERKGYSGTAIFTKCVPQRVINNIPKQITKKFNLKDNYGDLICEGRVLTVELKDVFITSVYAPNAKEDLSRIPIRREWDLMFLEYMKHLNKTKPVIFCGDFNVAHTELDLARPKQNKGKKGFTQEERIGFERFLKNGFIDVIRKFHEGVPGIYTWWSHWGKSRERNVGWRIDYILVSDKLLPKIKSSTVHQKVLGSDHCPVSINIETEQC